LSFLSSWNKAGGVGGQGDKIGRIFANLAFIYFGIFLNIIEVAPIFKLLFSAEK
jgi:hypothetical protein